MNFQNEDFDKATAQRAKDRDRKRKTRSNYSEEKKNQIRAQQREYMQNKRCNMSNEERERERMVAAERIQNKRLNMSNEERQTERMLAAAWKQNKRLNMSNEERQRERTLAAEQIQNKRLNMSNEERQRERMLDAEGRRQARLRLSDEELQQLREQQSNYRSGTCFRSSLPSTNITENTIVERNHYLDDINMDYQADIFGSIDIPNSIQRSQTSIGQTLLAPEEAGYIENASIHKGMVCVVCDCCITGNDKVHWIEKKLLKYHENILSPLYFYQNGLNPILKQQYTMNDNELSHLLLSPRTRQRITDDSYMCCDFCFPVLSEEKQRKKPPKFAISNGFAIGYLPHNMSKDITPLVNNLVAPVRAFNYFVSFSGGKEQKITGNFTFFAQDVSQNIGALQHTATANNNPSVFIVLLGSFTTGQLDKIRKQGSYNVETFKSVYQFLHENNHHYTELPSINNIPLPRVEQIRLNEENDTEEESTNPIMEEQLCWRYWFPAIEDPVQTSGSYQNQGDFAKALFIGETPTLFFHPTKVMAYAKLSQLCPIAFPFGSGDVDCKRKPAVSEIECLQHYLRLSLPQFLEGQTVLIIHHIFQRRRSFLTGITKCNICHDGGTIAEQLATVTVEQVEEAITQMKQDKRTREQQSTAVENINPHVSELLKCIKTSCAPIGYTNEAATEARNKMFALWMTFGPPSLLFTFSPCDECSFRMQLHATAECKELLSIHTPVEILSREFGLRKSMRVRYPGACAREFDSLLQIVIKDLIGWEDKQQKHMGIFGKISAYAVGVEEQGRTSLHGHIILWVHNYHILQQQIFSKDASIRMRATNELEQYLNKVLSSSFNVTEEDVNLGIHSSKDGSYCDGVLENVPLQNLREMRHRELLKKHNGKIITCNKCNKLWSTTDIINGIIENLLLPAKSETPDYWPSNITFPLQHEQVELLALRYQYDKIYIGEHKCIQHKLLDLISMLFFNTHDWRHRKGCFKKSNECRFHIPQQPCTSLTFHYGEVCEEELLSDDPSSSFSKWYHLDGSYHNVCSYDVLSKRDPWDVFVNTNNPTVTGLFGYNNNICMGSINTLYYCTLYTSKSNQEDETYPYVKALEAVSSRLKRVQENDSENHISPRQIGLRHLLSGINSHISSCVVSATMAWYLVKHGTRFHFSHDFKPFLLSQLEAWYHGKRYTRRIRYQKNRRRRRNNITNPHGSQLAVSEQASQSDDETPDVWFDSSVNDYIFRPDPEDSTFENICAWEYVSRYDLVTRKAESFMDKEDTQDINGQHFRFSSGHPGYEYSCLEMRKNECIPKLYYSNKFPDVAALEIDKSNNVEEHVKALREEYALKAMLMFYPFRNNTDLLRGHDNLWSAFMEQKNRLSQCDTNTELQPPSLYKHSLQILQNIQDLINIKKIPNGGDILESHTEIDQTDILHEYSLNQNNDQDDNDDNEDYTGGYEEQIEQLAQYVNLLSDENSIFNNNLTQLQDNMRTTTSTSILTIKSSDITSPLLHNSGLRLNIQNNEDANDSRGANQVSFQNQERLTRSIVTVLTRALESEGLNLLPSLQSNNTAIETADTISMTITSLDQFALQNDLDRKQKLAFQAICSSFMMSFLLDSSMDISQNERDHYITLLQGKGAVQQLLMCVTGPGGSGKSHVVKCCRLYCKQFCDALGKPFNFSVFPITATTNAAASLLQGLTIHMAAMLNSSKVQMEDCIDVTWTITKVLIIDEISLADKNLFRKLDKNLRILTGNRHLLYGGIHIIFTGDFMQLAPVQGSPIFSSDDDLLWHQSLNSAVFLDERNHRFINDTEWGEILRRVQVGLPTDEDIDKMNERLLNKVTLPNNIDCSETRIAYGCYTNKRRNQITDACFLQYISTTCPIFNSVETPSTSALIIKGVVTKNRRDVGPEFHKLLWALCGDDNLSIGKQTKVDPCLKLITGCPLMINSNTERKRKIVKGLTGHYIGVRWKRGCQPHIENYHGYKVNAAHVTDIDCLIFKSSVDDRELELFAELFSPSIKFPGCNNKNMIKGYRILQFPFNLSLAITGHKLQGMTLDIMILSEIHLQQNWLYVLLSRVTTRYGLYLMKPLSKEMFRPLSRNLKRELEWLRKLELQLLGRLEVGN